MGTTKKPGSENVKGDSKSRPIWDPIVAVDVQKDRLVYLLQSGKCRVHLVVGPEPLRDSAGSPLSTRDAS